MRGHFLPSGFDAVGSVTRKEARVTWVSVFRPRARGIKSFL